MAVKEVFYSGKNLEAVLASMEDFSAQIGEVVEMRENQPACSFSCDQCDKICKTQRMLKNLYQNCLMMNFFLKIQEMNF